MTLREIFNDTKGDEATRGLCATAELLVSRISLCYLVVRRPVSLAKKSRGYSQRLGVAPRPSVRPSVPCMRRLLTERTNTPLDPMLMGSLTEIAENLLLLPCVRS